ncbi:MAG TPA: hypothetical protein VI794_03280 [Patescibacteria group bacterium]|nr:hypothetical protein [Patescibacteria group bacterium]
MAAVSRSDEYDDSQDLRPYEERADELAEEEVDDGYATPEPEPDPGPEPDPTDD